MKRTSLLPAILVILGVLVASTLSTTPLVGFRSPDELDEPVCDSIYPGSTIACYLIDGSSISVMDEAFENATASNWTEFHLVLIGCKVDDFPDNAFAALGTDLVSISFNVNCSMTGIPNRILSSVASPLKELQFMGVETIQSIGAQDFAGLPFANDLEALVFQLDVLSVVEGSAFVDFVNLKELTITGTSVSNFPVDLLSGLVNLLELTVTDNSRIQTLPNQFLAQQSLLVDVWLGDNDLQFLEQGTLDGLTSVQMLSVAGNPFYCNCSLEWFKDWLVTEDLLEASGATCQYPESAPFDYVNFCP